jgi:GntR family transcriptional regulator/MocR family aminotransferase
MVVPDHLLAATLRTQAASETWTSAIDELALAEFLTSGGYDHHVRASRQRYRRRRDQLVDSLAGFAPQVRVTGIAAGLHALVELPTGTEQAAVAGVRAEDLAVQHLDFFRFGEPPPQPDRDALIIGYAAPPDHLYPAALAALRRALSAIIA